MDILTFISEIIKATIWPVVVSLGLLLFKDPISEIMQQISKFKYKNVEMEFREQFSDLEENVNLALPLTNNTSVQHDKFQHLLALVTVSPKSAILETWKNIESLIIKIAQNKEIELHDYDMRKPLKISANLLNAGVIDKFKHDIINSLRVIRNEVKHYDLKKITPEEAITYIDSASRLMVNLTNEILKEEEIL